MFDLTMHSKDSQEEQQNIKDLDAAVHDAVLNTFNFNLIFSEGRKRCQHCFQADARFVSRVLFLSDFLTSVMIPDLFNLMFKITEYNLLKHRNAGFPLSAIQSGSKHKHFIATVITKQIETDVENKSQFNFPLPEIRNSNFKLSCCLKFLR